MNFAFNVEFMDRQSTMEQLFNHGSLQEFKGETGQGFIARALDELDQSLDGLAEARRHLDEMRAILDERPVSEVFARSLRGHLEGLGVNQLPRLGSDERAVSTLADILDVLGSEFDALETLTRGTQVETEALQPDIDDGLFVARVLENQTGFNQQKISLGFGRDTVSVFMSTACHATILAVEDQFPDGFEALFEPKTFSDLAQLPGETTDNGIDLVQILMLLLAFAIGVAAATAFEQRRKGRGVDRPTDDGVTST